MLENCGEISMFVEYADDHAADTFKMLKLNTKRIWKSRDICWIAPSVTAYASLQLNHTKANMKDNDFDEPNTKKPSATVAPNPIPTANTAANDPDNQSNAFAGSKDAENTSDYDNNSTLTPLNPKSLLQCKS